MIAAKKKELLRRNPVEVRLKQVEEIIATANIDNHSTLSDILQLELRESYPSSAIIDLICQLDSSIVSLPNKSDESTALHVACANPNLLYTTETIKYLIDASPAVVYAKNKFGLAPIHKAVGVAGTAHLETIKYLVQLDPKILMAQTIDGQTPLHFCLSYPRLPNVEVCKYLIEACPKSLLVSDSYGHLPIHKASAKCKIDFQIIEMLVHGSQASVSLKDNKGMLPIHCAIFGKSEPNVEVLFLLSEIYPEGLLDSDYDGNTPYMRYMMNRIRNKEVEAALMDLTELSREIMKDRIKSSGIVVTTNGSAPPSRNSKRFVPKLNNKR